MKAKPCILQTWSHWKVQPEIYRIERHKSVADAKRAVKKHFEENELCNGYPVVFYYQILTSDDFKKCSESTFHAAQTSLEEAFKEEAAQHGMKPQEYLSTTLWLEEGSLI